MRQKLKLKMLLNALSILIALRKKKNSKTTKKRQKKKYWIHPINLLRNSIGFYSVYVPVLRKFPEKFKFVFHVSVEIFDLIVGELSPSLFKKSSRALSPDFKCYVYFR